MKMRTQNIYQDQTLVQAFLATAAEIHDNSKCQQPTHNLTDSLDKFEMSWDFESSFKMNFKPPVLTDPDEASIISEEQELVSDYENEADISCNNGK